MCGDADKANCGVFQLLKHVLDNPNLDPGDIVDQYQEIKEEIDEECDY